jgi:hypothetical protein
MAGHPSFSNFVVDQQSGMGRSRICNPGLRNVVGSRPAKASKIDACIVTHSLDQKENGIVGFGDNATLEYLSSSVM